MRDAAARAVGTFSVAVGGPRDTHPVRCAPWADSCKRPQIFFVGTSRGVGKFLSSAQAHRDTSGCRHCRAPPRAAVLCPSISADLKGHLRDSSPVADGLTTRKDAGGQRSGAGWTPKFTRHRYFGATCRGRISRCSELELCPGQPALAYRHHAPSLEASNGRRGEWRRRA